MTNSEFLYFLDEFKKIKTFNDRMDFANRNLNKISSGSGRIVYDIDGTKVFKLAYNQKGIVQNEAEISAVAYDDYDDILTKIFEFDDNNYWLVAEKARKLSKERFRQLVGFDISDVSHYLINDDLELHGKSGVYYIDPKINSEMHENEFIQRLRNFMIDYDQHSGDLKRLSTYGEVIREGTPSIVLIDYGLTHKNYDQYYNPQTKNNRRNGVYEIFQNHGNDDILSDIGGGEDIRRGIFATTPYDVSDGDGVINENYNAELADLLANQISEKLNLQKPKKIGEGTFGFAYDIGNDKILKITKDKSEAVENLSLINKSLNYIAQPYNVFSIKSKSNQLNRELFAIVLEKLKTSVWFERTFKKLNKLFERKMNVNLSNVVDYYIDGDDYNGKIDVDKIMDIVNSNPDYTRYFWGILNIISEVKKHFIESKDFVNPYNLGFKKDGLIGFFDVGFGNYFKKFENEPSEIEVNEDGCSKFTTTNGVGQDDFPIYNQIDTTPSIDNNIPVNVNERKLSYMKGGSTVEVKKKCRLGGLGNVSAPCNQGDVSNLKIKRIKENK